jgi:hypothetical protein
MGRLAA